MTENDAQKVYDSINQLVEDNTTLYNGYSFADILKYMNTDSAGVGFEVVRTNDRMFSVMLEFSIEEEYGSQYSTAYAEQHFIERMSDPEVAEYMVDVLYEIVEDDKKLSALLDGRLR